MDTSLITGNIEHRQTGRKRFRRNNQYFAPLRIRVTATGQTTLLAEIVRLMENANRDVPNMWPLPTGGKIYAPVVHILSGTLFSGLVADWRDWLAGCLMNAIRSDHHLPTLAP
ncbi:hypothetical protein [Thalassospira alkalitolerans]|uniref:hypothetical protein n=1 Tax=Thalassospira alkalitolerans TaxID=1293890 RepID=UPI003AA8310C